MEPSEIEILPVITRYACGHKTNMQEVDGVAYRVHFLSNPCGHCRDELISKRLLLSTEQSRNELDRVSKAVVDYWLSEVQAGVIKEWKESLAGVFDTMPDHDKTPNTGN